MWLAHIMGPEKNCVNQKRHYFLLDSKAKNKNCVIVKTYTVFPSLRHAGLIFFYFGNSGIISKWGLISETMIRVGLNFYFFRIPGIITVKFLL